jgi:hypothetical protein
MLPSPRAESPRNKTRNEPMISIGVWIADIVITPFIPPNTVNIAVIAIRPSAPYQKGSPNRYSKKIPPVNAVTLTLVKI